MLWMLGCFAMMAPPVTNPTAAAPPAAGANPTASLPAGAPAGAPRPGGPPQQGAPYQPPAPPPPPGSLWSEVGSRTLIGMDGNARRVGDLITVLISETASTSLDATTDTSRSGSASLGIEAMLGLETSLVKGNSTNMTNGLTVGGNSETSHTGTGTTSRNTALAATLTCDVMEVLPNGNLRIRGTKTLRVNGETQYLTLDGVVRPRDILLDNTVRSDVIADPHIEFTGAGAIASKQHQGWGTAVMDAVWPF